MQQTTPSPCLLRSQPSVLWLSKCISDEKTESSNFDSLIPVIAALDNLTIFVKEYLAIFLKYYLKIIEKQISDCLFDNIVLFPDFAGKL